MFCLRERGERLRVTVMTRVSNAPSLWFFAITSSLVFFTFVRPLMPQAQPRRQPRASRSPSCPARATFFGERESANTERERERERETKKKK